jgi:hypothetical protein
LEELNRWTNLQIKNNLNNWKILLATGKVRKDLSHQIANIHNNIFQPINGAVIHPELAYSKVKDNYAFIGPNPTTANSNNPKFDENEAMISALATGKVRKDLSHQITNIHNNIFQPINVAVIHPELADRKVKDNYAFIAPNPTTPNSNNPKFDENEAMISAENLRDIIHPELANRTVKRNMDLGVQNHNSNYNSANIEELDDDENGAMTSDENLRESLLHKMLTSNQSPRSKYRKFKHTKSPKRFHMILPKPTLIQEEKSIFPYCIEVFSDKRYINGMNGLGQLCFYFPENLFELKQGNKAYCLQLGCFKTKDNHQKPNWEIVESVSINGHNVPLFRSYKYNVDGVYRKIGMNLNLDLTKYVQIAKNEIKLKLNTNGWKSNYCLKLELIANLTLKKAISKISNWQKIDHMISKNFCIL